MRRGFRFIAGREYLLCGRHDTLAEANAEAALLRAEWDRVLVRRLPNLMGNWSVWVNGAKPRKEAATRN